MITLLTVSLVMLGLLMLLCIGKLWQLNQFYPFIREKINCMFETGQWPDITRSYDKLRWTMPWNTKFESIIVYEKRK